MRARYKNDIPTDDVPMYLSDIADRLFPGKPASFKDEFVRDMKRKIDDWIHAHGGPWLMAAHWGLTDARIRVAIRNEGLQSIYELAARSDAELLLIPNFGYGSLRRVREITTGKSWKDPRTERTMQRLTKKLNQKLEERRQNERKR